MFHNLLSKFEAAKTSQTENQTKT